MTNKKNLLNKLEAILSNTPMDEIDNSTSTSAGVQANELDSATRREMEEDLFSDMDSDSSQEKSNAASVTAELCAEEESESESRRTSIFEKKDYDTKSDLAKLTDALCAEEEGDHSDDIFSMVTEETTIRETPNQTKSGLAQLTDELCAEEESGPAKKTTVPAEKVTLTKQELDDLLEDKENSEEDFDDDTKELLESISNITQLETQEIDRKEVTRILKAEKEKENLKDEIKKEISAYAQSLINSPPPGQEDKEVPTERTPLSPDVIQQAKKDTEKMEGRPTEDEEVQDTSSSSERQRVSRKQLKEAIISQLDEQDLLEILETSQKSSPTSEPLSPASLSNLRNTLLQESSNPEDNAEAQAEFSRLQDENKNLQEQLKKMRKELLKTQQNSNGTPKDYKLIKGEFRRVLDELDQQKKSVKNMRQNLLEIKRENLDMSNANQNLQTEIQHLVDVTEDLKDLPSMERFLEYIEASRQQLKRDSARYRERFEERFKRIQDKYFHLEKVIAYVREIKDLLKSEILETQADLQEEQERREQFESKLAKFEERIQIADNQKSFFQERCRELEYQLNQLRTEREAAQKKASYQESEMTYNLETIQENTQLLNKLLQKMVDPDDKRD